MILFHTPFAITEIDGKCPFHGNGEAKTTCGGENDMSGDLLLALQYRVSKKRLLASAAASPTDGTEPPDS